VLIFATTDCSPIMHAVPPVLDLANREGETRGLGAVLFLSIRRQHPQLWCQGLQWVWLCNKGRMLSRLQESEVGCNENPKGHPPSSFPCFVDLPAGVLQMDGALSLKDLVCVAWHLPSGLECGCWRCTCSACAHMIVCAPAKACACVQRMPCAPQISALMGAHVQPRAVWDSTRPPSASHWHSMLRPLPLVRMF